LMVPQFFKIFTIMIEQVAKEKIKLVTEDYFTKHVKHYNYLQSK
jgi:hypothetical protein